MRTKIEANCILSKSSEIFAKQDGERTLLISVKSDNLINLDEQASEIWALIQEPIKFQNLVALCEENYENFGEEEIIWLSEFLTGLAQNNVIELS